MQKIQLYIEGQRVDFFKDETISITQSIKNVKDVSKIFTSFTKTFAVPASKINNILFKHFYNYDIVNGFDARLKKPAEIQLNSLPFKTGRVRLEGVDLKNNAPNLYRITFFGNTVELPDVLGDDKLGALGFANYTLQYNPLNIKNYLENTVGDGDIIVPLITHSERLYFDSSVHIKGDGNLSTHSGGGTNIHGVLWNELKYAIRLQKIIEEIETRYSAANGYAFPITFSTQFFNVNNPEWNNLYMWLHRKSGSVAPASQVVSYVTSLPLVGNNSTNTALISQSNGYFFVPEFYTENPNIIYQGWSISFVTQDTVNPYRLIISLNGTTIYTSPFEVTGSFNFNQNPAFVGDGNYLISIQHSEQILFDSITLTADGRANAVSYTDTLSVTSFTAQKEFEFIISEQIPDVTIISFLTGLFTTFNLTAYIQDDGSIYVDTLDNYYLAGKSGSDSWDISKYVDVTKSQVNAALPYREIKYEYEGLGTYLAKQHEQLQGYGWGSLSYIGGDNPDGTGGINYNAVTKIYNVKVPFEHMKMERMIDQDNGASTTIQWGYSVNENEQPYIGKPLLFYPIRQAGTGITPITFLTSETTKTDIDSYHIPSNSVFLDPVTSQDNLNFGLELNEYTGGNNFDDTLFSDYHSNYIIDVFNNRRRLTKVSAFFPLRILYNFKLNDTFIINSRNYIINSITTNLQTGKSDMELLNKVYPDGQGGVQPPDELLPPTNLRLVSTTQDSITVAWDLPLQPIDNVGLDLNQGQYGYVNGLDTGFTFEDLQGQTSYTIAVYSILQQDTSDLSNILQINL